MNLYFRKIKFYFRAYQRLEIMNKAASLSFYTFISIFPLSLFLVAVTQYFISPAVLTQEITRFLQNTLPYQSELIIDNLKLLFHGKHPLSWFGIISLIISAQILYVNMEKIINSLLHIPKRRHFLMTRLLFLLWLFSMVFALFAPVMVEFMFAGISSLGFRIPFIAKLFNQSAGVLMAYCMFWLIMTVLPARRVQMKKIFRGALFFTLAFLVGKTIFKWVTLRNFARYNLIYGSLSTFALVALWIFYFYNIFLFCVYWVGREHDPLYLEQKTNLERQ